MRRVFLALGFLCVGLGSVGAMVPVLPTTPFLLLAAALFAKSSPRAEAWLRRQSLYRNYVEVYRQEGPLPLKTRVRIVVTVSLICALSFLLMKNPIGRSALVIVVLGHWLYFFLILPRRQQKNPQ